MTELAIGKLNKLTALFCATMTDLEEQGLLRKTRGDAQQWFKKHKENDKRHREEQRAEELLKKFTSLSVDEQEEVLKRRKV